VDGFWKTRLFSLPYDISRIYADFLESSLLEAGGALARCFLQSIETGEDISLKFLQYAFTLTKQAGYSNETVIPDEIWDKAARDFNWQRANKQ
jgi:hypothetical protein